MAPYVASYVARRAVTAAFTLLVATALAYSAMLLVPGDPARAILGMEADPQAVAALQRQLGLDRPPMERFGRWLAGVVRGDLGQSLRYQRPVAELVGQRLALTVPLVSASLAVAGVAALVLGVAAATRPDTGADLAVRLGALVGGSLPTFWIGLMLILLFSVRWGMLPSGGFSGWQDPLRAARELALPVATLALARTPLLARMVRAGLLESLEQPYIRTARAKGLGEGPVVLRHALRNALIPVMTVLGLEFSQLLVAGVVVESVFALPGLGTLALVAIEARDYPLVQGIVLVLAAFIVAVNLAVDLLYAAVDPRVAHP